MPTKRQPAPEPTDPLDDYTPVQLAYRENGWTAERQRAFLAALAETGSVTEACIAAAVSPRSAYRLRLHPKGEAFNHAWTNALVAASHRLTTIAFERATRGAIREVWKDGELVSETRQPSDRLLMFLLHHLAPHLFHEKPRLAWPQVNPLAAPLQLAEQLPALADVDLPAEGLTPRDFEPTPPGSGSGNPAGVGLL